MIYRLDGAPVGNRGLLSTCWTITSAGFEPAVPANPMRVGLIIQNIGPATAYVRAIPNELNPFTASNGFTLLAGGVLTIDKYYPWTGAFEIQAPDQVDINELSDGGGIL